MIHIFFGDNVAASREEFLKSKEEFLGQGHDSFSFDEQSISQLKSWIYDSTSLFSNKKILIAENILRKKEIREQLREFESTETHTEILIWDEEIDERTLKFAFKNVLLHQFKLPSNIFKFLDSVSPGNLAVCIEHLKQIMTTVEPSIILFMLERRVKDLILISLDQKLEKEQADWQIARLKSQAAKWKKEKLVSFYDGLYRIEVMTKTSGGYYDIAQALDILLCYYL